MKRKHDISTVAENRCRVKGGDASHLVVPDHSDVCWRASGVAVVRDVVVFGSGNPAGGEEERVQLHAQRFPPHVLDWQLPTEKEANTCNWYNSHCFTIKPPLWEKDVDRTTHYALKMCPSFIIIKTVE